MDPVYCYPDTDVLINKLHIRDKNRLRDAEKKLVNLRVFDLIERPAKGGFDFAHLQKIHGYLFQDLYDWAGKIRTVDIAKGNMFCRVPFIQTQADNIFRKLKAEHYLKGLSQEEFPAKLAWYFSEINALHPFREGNGRSQREFIRELALYHNYKILFSRTEEEELLKASIDSFLCRYKKMEQVFRKCLVKPDGR
ncbi:MAG: cell filamentation protein Fic [Lachnospiraceae bacterium]|nr:cell filamentation protein Fic [Lachnospiraceae bacterium]